LTTSWRNSMIGAGAAVAVASPDADAAGTAKAKARARARARARDERGRELIDRHAGGNRRTSLAASVMNVWSGSVPGLATNQAIAAILGCVMVFARSRVSVHTPACGGSARRPGEGERQRSGSDHRS